MTRLIDADALIDSLNIQSVTYNCIINKCIEDAPTIDAVKVVRCKDCYHAEDDITHMFCVYFYHKVYEDDYCSNAVERKEDGEA